MDMKTYAEQCRQCDPELDPQMAQQLLLTAAKIADEIDKARNKRADKIPYNDILNDYNSICTSLAHAHKLSDKRKRAIKQCYSQGFTYEDLKKAFNIAQNSPFLVGNNERAWRAGFDFIIKPDNILKILEGTYGTKKENTQATSSHSYNLDKIMDYYTNNTPSLKNQ